MSHIWFERKHLGYFDDSYVYKGYALVNEIYEDDDHRANTWMWGQLDNEYIVEARLLEGLSSNSYAPWAEVCSVFKAVVDEKNLQKSENSG